MVLKSEELASAQMVINMKQLSVQRVHAADDRKSFTIGAEGTRQSLTFL